MRSPSADKQVVVAQFAGPHGVRGDFKLRSFTDDPEAVFGYGPLLAGSGQALDVKPIRMLKPDLFLCRADGIDSPEACEPLKGSLLTVSRDALPPSDEEDDFYVEDLIGLEARSEDGAVLGRVRAVPNYGAGDIIEVDGPGGLMLVPFTRDAVPAVHLSEGYLVLIPPGDDDGTAPKE